MNPPSANVPDVPHELADEGVLSVRTLSAGAAVALELAHQEETQCEIVSAARAREEETAVDLQREIDDVKRTISAGKTMDDEDTLGVATLREQIEESDALESALLQELDRVRAGAAVLRERLAVQLVAAEKIAAMTTAAIAEGNAGDFSPEPEPENVGASHSRGSGNAAPSESDSFGTSCSSSDESSDDDSAVLSPTISIPSTFHVLYMPRDLAQPRNSGGQSAPHPVDLVITANGVAIYTENQRMVEQWPWTAISGWTFREVECGVNFHINSQTGMAKSSFGFETDSRDDVCRIKEKCDVEVMMIMSRRQAQQQEAERRERTAEKELDDEQAYKLRQLQACGVDRPKAFEALVAAEGDFLEAARSLGVTFKIADLCGGALGMPNRCNDCFWLATCQALRHIPGFAKATCESVLRAGEQPAASAPHALANLFLAMVGSRIHSPLTGSHQSCKYAYLTRGRGFAHFCACPSFLALYTAGTRDEATAVALPRNRSIHPAMPAGTSPRR